MVEVLPSTITVDAGQRLTLRCNIKEGTLPVRLIWSKVGAGSLPAGAFDNRNGVLDINEAEVSDAGRYKCQGINSAGQSEALASVIINMGKVVSYLCTFNL